MQWDLTEAQRRLEELMDLARDEEPQFIAWQGKEYVLLTMEEYLRLKSRKPTFIEHLLSIPKGDDLDLTRDKRPLRDIEW